MIDKLIALLAQTRRTAGERGASAVEYGLLIAGIAALIVVVVFAFGTTIAGVFTDTCNEVGGAGSC